MPNPKIMRSSEAQSPLMYSRSLKDDEDDIDDANESNNNHDSDKEQE